MRTFANCICLLAMATLLSGCSSCFQQPEADANYGSTPVNYELAIKEYFESVLIDSESARYKFSQPVKAYENEGLLAGGEVLWLGYLIETKVNAKNRLGGYVGYQPYVVLFKGNDIYRVQKMDWAYATLIHRAE